jgi:ubiquinone/menaquinone biosynthesis C-methylase UbiE
VPRSRLKTPKAAVSEYWESRPCGTTLSEAPLASPEFFDDVERRRYAAEPFIHDFAEFSAWRGRTILEVGTGIGSDFLNFVRAGALAVGIDLTAAAVDLVRARLSYQQLHSPTLVADAESLPFGDESFDLVYSWGVLHHTPDTGRAVREVHRVLRPRGEARIMLYSRRSWVALGLWVRHALLRGHPQSTLSEILSRHLESPGTKAFTANEIRALFSPFSSISMKTFVTPYDRRVAGPLTRLLPAGFFIGIVATKD